MHLKADMYDYDIGAFAPIYIPNCWSDRYCIFFNSEIYTNRSATKLDHGNHPTNYFGSVFL